MLMVIKGLKLWAICFYIPPGMKWRNLQYSTNWYLGEDDIELFDGSLWAVLVKVHGSKISIQINRSNCMKLLET